MRNGFPKSERLKSYTVLKVLFKEGKSLRSNNIRFIYLTDREAVGLRCGVGVSGKYFKKAVSRNRIKRLLREAYRLQKSEIEILSEKIKLDIFILYTGISLPQYDELYKNVGEVLSKLEKELHANIP